MKKNSSKDPKLTVKAAAQRLGIRLESTYRLLYAGLLAGQRVNGKWEIEGQSVENYAAKHSRKGQTNG